MTKHTEKVLFTKLTVLSTPENGFKTSSMAMESKVGQMAPNMKVTMRSGSSTELVLLNGQINQFLLVSSTVTIFMAKVFTLGKTVVNMKENGEQTECMEKEHSPGQMEGSL